MLRTLKDLYDAITAQPETKAGPESEHALQLATAVLLVEVMRSDHDIDALERRAVLAALRERFMLAEDEVARLLQLAEQTAEDAYDFHRFTSLLNQRFSAEQKVLIIESMWRVAYADNLLSAHENHLMRKIAALLYIPHAEYVGAKLRARPPASGGD
ncbi:MAG: TerB family tellurite resistance protein [Rhodocyclales bacterium]|nr:TerB family tellurite resistance protein [Rhodocyclales bacterium]